MKKLVSLFAALLFVGVAAQAQTFTAENADGVTIKYQVLSADEQTVSVVTHTYTDRIAVPDSVVYNDTTWTVTSIGTAFRGKPVTHLWLPATVKQLEQEAFVGCNSLDTVWLASESVVAVPMVAGYYRPERIFFSSGQNSTLCVRTVVVAPCGSLAEYRCEHWSTFPSLTSTCAVPVKVIPLVDSIYRFDSIEYRENGKRYVHFSNRSYEVGDTARIWAQRWKISPNSTTNLRHGWFMGWSNGRTDLDFSFVVEHADTIICYADTFHYAYLSASRISTPVFNFGTLSYDGFNGLYSFRDMIDGSSRPSTLFSSSLWVGSGEHVAAARFLTDGCDYLPGPLRVADGTTDISTALRYNRVWHVTRQMIDYHIAHCGESGYEIPDDILSWPGNGDIADGFAAQLAPYYDADSNGRYDARAGDYPLIRGDEAVFSIFNDAGLHTESNSLPLGIEIHCMAYAFTEPNDTALWNTVFVNYDIYNRSANTYPDTYLGAWSDIDLGYAWDDYIGCDVKRGMYYTYNGNDNDQVFGNILPAQGCAILGGATLPTDGMDNPKINIPYILSSSNASLVNLLQSYSNGNGYDTAALSRDAQLFFDYDYQSWFFLPAESLGNMALNGLNFGDGIADNERMGMTHFHYYDNSRSSLNGEPTVGLDYYNYMRSYWKSGSEMMTGDTVTPHVKYGGNGLSSGIDPDNIDCNFMFPGDSDPWSWGTNGIVPSITPDDWTEVSAGNAPGDRRGVGSSGPFNFEAGSRQQLDIAFVTGFSANGTSESIRTLQRHTDNVRRQFVHDTTDSGRPFTYMPYSAPHPVGIAEAENESVLNIYPNPTSGILSIVTSVQGQLVELYDMTGRRQMSVTATDGSVTLNLSSLPRGIYLLKVGDAPARRIAVVR